MHYSNPVDRLIGRMEAELGYATVEEMLRTDLHDFLEQIEHGLFPKNLPVQRLAGRFFSWK
uniref:Uncharacterized protein n=1 Tax=Chlorobium phaeobacteroides (strain BS1) TaxID=331678 RepID=B3EJB7_CHLPB